MMMKKQGSKPKNKPVLKVSKLRFQYPDQDSPILDKIDLKLYPGEIRILIGRSGSGKSTLLNALCGFIPHSIDGDLSGVIKINGENIQNKTIYEIAKDISMVQQDPEAQLCTTDVFNEIAFALENFMYPPKVIKNRVQKILMRLGIDHLKDRKIHNLSGGEKQKVAIASMLVLKPKILVFDEPTANLDPHSTQGFIEFLDTLKHESNIGILIVDHNPQQYMSIADHLLFLEQRKINHIYRSHEFKRFNNQYYNKIYNNKFTKNITNNIPNQPPTTIDQYILKIKNLNFKYNSHPVLKNLDLTVSSGEFIGLMGNNGSGKTTLIQNILGLLNPNKGEIIIKSNGTKIYNNHTYQISKNIGYVFQNPNHMIFGDTVWHEVMIGPKNFKKDLKSSAKSALELLKLGGLNKFKNVHPMLLSYGEKRRLNIASILSYDPELIILDEPFIGQDPENIVKILNYLLHMISLGKSVIMATHRVDIIQKYCNRLLFLKDGKLILDAPIKEGFNQLSVLGENSYLPKFKIFDRDDEYKNDQG